MIKNQDASDVDLMALVSAGDHQAFSMIVTRHTRRFFSLAFRMLGNQSDAEDIVQAAFIKLWQKPTSWDKDRSEFTTWFYRVIMNACYDHLRKQKHLSSVPDMELESVIEPTLSEQHNLEISQQNAWQQYCLEEAIRQLPASQRDALNLVIYLALPQKQAAEVMGISLKAIESLLVRAKRSMKATINKLSSNKSIQPLLRV